MADPVLFPGVLGQIADAIGEDLATRLAEQLGGHEVQIPKTPRPGNMVVDVIGEDAARILAAEIGHGRLRLPMGPARRDERIRALLRDGRPHREIARAVGVHRRTVEYHAQRMRQHNGPPGGGDQRDLFD